MKTTKRVISVVLALVLFGGVAFSPSSAGTATAAGKAYMKGLKVNWGLKKNKACSVTGTYVVIGKKGWTFKIKNYKVSNASKKGYKKLTYTVVCTRQNWSISPSEVHKIVNSSYSKRTGKIGSGFTCAVVDYDTGLDLEEKNNFNVTVKNSEWKNSNTKIYKDSDGCSASIQSTGKCKVTITYPKEYDGLCIAVMGCNQLNDSKADNAFWKGKKAFGATSYYKKGKKNSHWMRVRGEKTPTATPTPKPTATPTPEPTETPEPEMTETMQD